MLPNLHSNGALLLSGYKTLFQAGRPVPGFPRTKFIVETGLGHVGCDIFLSLHFSKSPFHSFLAVSEYANVLHYV